MIGLAGKGDDTEVAAGCLGKATEPGEQIVGRGAGQGAGFAAADGLITALNNGLMKFTGTILFTSQDLQFNETIATRVIELTPTGQIDYGISYEEYLKTL